MKRVVLASGTRYDIGSAQVVWTQEQIASADKLLGEA